MDWWSYLWEDSYWIEHIDSIDLMLMVSVFLAPSLSISPVNWMVRVFSVWWKWGTICLTKHRLPHQFYSSKLTWLLCDQLFVFTHCLGCLRRTCHLLFFACLPLTGALLFRVDPPLLRHTAAGGKVWCWNGLCADQSFGSLSSAPKWIWGTTLVDSCSPFFNCFNLAVNSYFSFISLLPI